MNNIQGLIAAPFTAFQPDRSLDLDKISQQADLLISNNVKGVFIGGTTGESMSLTAEERKAIAEQWIKVSPSSFKIFVHSGHTSLSDCKAIAKHAQDIGAFATGAMGPFFYKPTTVDDLVSFTKEVAESAPELPFYYYHIPSMTGIDFPMVEYLEAARGQISNLAGIKYTHSNLMDFKLCQSLDNGSFELLYGRDETLLCGLSLGATGAIGSTYNYMAPLYNQITEAWNNNEIIEAQELQLKAMKFVRILNKYGGGIVGGKAVMKLTGINCGPVRPPLKKLSDKQLMDLQNELDQIGYFEFAVDKVS